MLVYSSSLPSIQKCLVHAWKVHTGCYKMMIIIIIETIYCAFYSMPVSLLEHTLSHGILTVIFIR